ncbi:uncharacterized protein LOC113239027 [Hyposmocoma kahamanoa]|uniref:uncharacterized protein LOC113239027 n=1 Tax=Hyposmocoma kahamanoa TaxID=1477025 RepID=UPI000E6D9818|nr:uncharacterized protein LOC113239027 [Hyposmocoma kahamanoa]
MTEVGSISLPLRVPPFWRDRPRLWFASFEAATHDLKKSQAQLSQMVIAQLDKQDIEQVSDLLFDPPKEDPYKALKARHISVYEESEERQFQKLLSEMELGDQRPTQLLRRMRNLPRDKVPDPTLRIMWMNHLPPHIRSVLVVSDTISKTAALDELALLADKMLEQQREISVVSTSSSPTTLASSSKHQKTEYQFLVEEIKKLSFEVAELKSSAQHDFRERPPASHYDRFRPRRRYTARRRDTTPPSRSHSRGQSLSPSPYCYYHKRFGSDARRCTLPCTYSRDDKRMTEN